MPKLVGGPDLGDIIWMNLDPQLGHEQRGRRMVLVLSPKSYNDKAGLCVVCPITTKVKGRPFEVAIVRAVRARGVVLADQVKSLSWVERGVVPVEKAHPAVVAMVRQRLNSILKLP